MSAKLIYLMGPSGSGKDSLIGVARGRLEAAGIKIARRVITRSAEASGEDALAVTPVEFEQMRESGAFALHWRANGLGYGIASEIDDWMRDGHSVLVNGSRSFLPKAQAKYPALVPVLLQVDAPVLRRRLLARGRESLGEIESRMARNSTFTAELGVDVHVLRLDNSGTLEEAGERFVALLQQSIL